VSFPQHIHEQAAKWFMRMRDAAPDAPDRSIFERWLLQNQAHANAYAAVAQTWDDFDSPKQLESLADAMLRKKLAQDAKRKKISAHLAKAAAVTMFGFIALFGYHSWQAQPVMQMAQNSAVGQIISQELSDGSKLTLDANSQVEVTYYRDKRLVKLMRGQAVFEVTKDAARPFVVDSETALITVLGTRFLVNRIDNRVRVAVDHGRVQVQAVDAKGNAIHPPIIITNGQMAEVTASLQANRIAHPAADAFAFTQGKLVFEEATLSEVAETLSRYRVKPVVADAASQPRDLQRITAVLKITEGEQFIHALPKIAAVKVLDTQKQTQLIQN
jgi:transmembrane sensor